jgi:hypothetical protein
MRTSQLGLLIDPKSDLLVSKVVLKNQHIKIESSMQAFFENFSISRHMNGDSPIGSEEALDGFRR